MNKTPLLSTINWIDFCILLLSWYILAKRNRASSYFVSKVSTHWEYSVNHQCTKFLNQGVGKNWLDFWLKWLNFVNRHNGHDFRKKNVWRFELSENGIDNALLFSIATKWAIKFRIHKIGINFGHMCLEVQCFLYLGVGLDYS